MTIPGVLKAWLDGRVAATDSMSTDGVKLWSYALLIATRYPTHVRLEVPELSVTTARHISTAAKVALAHGLTVSREKTGVTP